MHEPDFCVNFFCTKLTATALFYLHLVGIGTIKPEGTLLSSLKLMGILQC